MASAEAVKVREGGDTPFESAPYVVLSVITAHLSTPDLLRLSQVSKTLSAALQDQALWRRSFQDQPLEINHGDNLSWKEACILKHRLKEMARGSLLVQSSSEEVSVHHQLGKPVVLASPNIHLEAALSPNGIWAAIRDYRNVTIHRIDGNQRHPFPLESSPFYFNWAPNSAFVLLMRNHNFGIALDAVSLLSWKCSPILEGRPIFLSWSKQWTSDSCEFVVNTNSTFRRCRIFEGEDGPEFEVLKTYNHPISGGAVPVWVNESQVLVAVEGDNAGLCLLDANTSELRQLCSGGSISYVASHDGQWAFRVPQSVPLAAEFCCIRNGQLTEFALGQVIMASWSPDSRKVALLVFANQTLGWRMVDVETWSVTEYGGVAQLTNISYMRQYLTFFEQYHQSLPLWSADSAAFHFIDGEGVFKLQPDGTQVFGAIQEAVAVCCAPT